MKQEFESAHFRNFFSFGNVRQDITFEPGINLILGLNASNGRSNFTGKSSLTEVLPVAMFGKSSKGVKKDQLVNWSNRKNCEVGVTIKIKNDTYYIFRAIKPDKLEIYKNDVLIPPSADVRDYQRMLEDDILSMDYNMFMSLIYTNLNKYEPILQMSKPNKRHFLERVFGLEKFSKLNDLANNKLKAINERVVNVNAELGSIGRLEREMLSQLDSLNTNLNRVGNSKSKLQLLYNEQGNLPDYDEISNELTELTEKLPLQQEKNRKDKELQVKIQSDIDIKANDVRMTNKMLDGYKNVRTDLKTVIESKKSYDELLKEYPDIDESILITENELKNLTNIVKSKNRDLVEAKEGRASANTNLKITTDNINTLVENDTCPLCGSNIKDNDVLDTLGADKKEYEDNVSKINTIINELSESIGKIDDNIKKYNDEHKGLLGIKINLNSLRDKIQNIDDLKGKLSKLKEVEDEIDKYNIQLKDLELIKSESDLDNTIKDGTDKERYIVNKIDDLQRTYKLFSTLNRDIESITQIIAQETKSRSDVQSMIDENTNKLKQYRVERTSKQSIIKKTNTMTDYLEMVKFICKDENIKQYAISNNMPYLNKQTNEYLSKCGMGYYIKLDNWMEEEILGPGISNCSYKSLSGAETKSLDLAIQFSFLDIARLQAGVFPDILLLDELLDSSVDGIGLDDILNMVKIRQYEDKSKVFLITHRQEIDDIEVDNTYLVEKRDGFSYLTKP